MAETVAIDPAELARAMEAPIRAEVASEVEAQATRMAEERLPQLVDARVEARMAAEVERMEAASAATLREALTASGLVDDEGQTIRPPGAPNGDAPGPFASFGEQLRAIQAAAYPGAVVHPGLAQILAATGASEGVPADGGFLLQPTFVQEILRVAHETGVVWGRIPPNRRMTLTGNSNSIKMPAVDETSRADGSRWGGVQMFRIEEGGTATPSRPKFKRLTLELTKVVGLTYFTGEQLADTPIVQTIGREAFGEELGFHLDNDAIRGSGVGEPLGIINAAALISQAAEAGQAAATIVFENIVNMYSRLSARSRGNAVWFINQDIEPQLQTMSLAVGTGGVPVYLPANGAAGSPLATLMSRPVVPIEQCATLGTAGDIILADMSQFWHIDKGGPQQASSIHVQFLTDEVAFRMIYRNDFRPFWTSALTPHSGGNTVSPFVALATRS